jgi:hypothetical protein
MRAMRAIVNTANDNSTLSVSETERQKIELATEGLAARHFNFPYYLRTKMNICNYVQSMREELNLSDHYREDVIILLGNFSVFFNFKKSFKEITRENVLSFLDSFRKPESQYYKMLFPCFDRFIQINDDRSSNKLPVKQ